MLHQLVSFGGTQDPLFSKAVLQSPAFEPMLDRKGMLEQTFQNFTALAGCSGQGVDCLRAASSDALKTANTQLNKNAVQGRFAVGPAADGNLIRQSPNLEFASGRQTYSFLVLKEIVDSRQGIISRGFLHWSCLMSRTSPTFLSPLTCTRTPNSTLISTSLFPLTPGLSSPKSKPTTHLSNLAPSTITPPRKNA